MRRVSPLLFALSGLAIHFLAPLPAHSQVSDSLRATPDFQVVPEVTADTVPQEGVISPGGAFLRSALLPGWGHARVGAYGRGAFFFATQSAAAFMVFKSQSRLTLARNRLTLMETVITARLNAQGVVDPDEVEKELAENESVADLRGLEEARANQREDWIALGVFFILLGGADAFVAAHLADFPAPVEVNLNGSPQGGVEIGVSVPVGF